MGTRKFLKNLTESLVKKISSQSKTDIESEVDSEIVNYFFEFFNLMFQFGFVVNEESKGLFPSSMTIRPVVWSDGFRDKHVVGNICLDDIEEEREHQADLTSLDLEKCCCFILEGKPHYLLDISYEFEKIWFRLGYINVFRNHRKKLLSKMISIENMSIENLASIFNYCRNLYGDISESLVSRIQSSTDSDIEKDVDSMIWYEEGDFYPNKDEREGVVIFNGKDGVHPLTICALKFPSQVKKGKKTSSFTFKEGVKENPNSKKGLYPSYKIKKEGEWYIPSAEELEHLGMLIEKGKFTVRIGTRLWSADRSDYMSDFLAKSINVCTYDIELLNQVKCSDDKLEWKCRILPFKQIVQ